MTADRSFDPERQPAAAYDRYSAKALLRFDREGRIETIRQLQALMVLDDAIGEHTMSAQLSGMLERERNRELTLEAAQGSRAPKEPKPR